MKHLVLCLMVITALSLTGCGAAANNEQSSAKNGSTELSNADKTSAEPNSAQTTFANIEVKDVPSGVAILSNLVKQLKKSVEDGDSMKVRESAAGMAQVWKVIQADIESNYSALYSSINENIAAVVEKSGLDMESEKTEFIDLGYQLYQEIRQLKDEMGGQ